MDDFRTQLAAVIDELLAAGKRPVFLAVDLDGIEEIKQRRSEESLRHFLESAIDSILRTTGASDAFSYEDRSIVAVIPDFERLKLFARIEKLRRSLPILSQTFDCTLRPGFDVLEYEEGQGVAGLIKQLVGRSAEQKSA
jgi:hypothetical protein